MSIECSERTPIFPFLLQVVCKECTSSFSTSAIIHDLDPDLLLSRYLPVQALDHYSTLLDVLPLSFLYGASLAKDDTGHLHVDTNSSIVQIHIRAGQYVGSSQKRPGKITIYDTLPYLVRSTQLLTQLKIRYSIFDNHPIPLSLINYIIRQAQHGYNERGHVAAAYAYLLLNGTNPEYMRLDQSALMTYFHKYLMTQSATPFPTTTRNMGGNALSRYFTTSISSQHQQQLSDANKKQSSTNFRAQYLRDQLDKHTQKMLQRRVAFKDIHANRRNMSTGTIGVQKDR